MIEIWITPAGQIHHSPQSEGEHFVEYDALDAALARIRLLEMAGDILEQALTSYHAVLFKTLNDDTVTVADFGPRVQKAAAALDAWRNTAVVK